MKKELIKTENYLLVVDDSEIKRGDWFLTDDKRIEQSAPDWNPREWHKKIIAHLPVNDLPILEGVPLLPPLEDDNNKDLFYQKQVMNPYPTGGQSYSSYEKGFVEGYNKAREKYKFTEEHAKYLFECGRNFQINADITFTVAREHLLQPKSPTHFEFEMESMTIDEIREQGKGFLHASTFKIKTTNSQGQKVACGKYIY